LEKSSVIYGYPAVVQAMFLGFERVEKGAYRHNVPPQTRVKG
jgi:hypothetical protein